MIRYLKTASKRLKGLIGRKIRLRFPPLRRIIAGFAILGLMFLSCVCGAAVMHFDLGPAMFFRNSFEGFEAWQQHAEQPISSIAGKDSPMGIISDLPEKTFDGFTLYTTTHATEARLIDMRGNLVHQWNKPFSAVWPKPAHVKYPVTDEWVHWFRCHLFSNGDLLAIYQTDSDTPHGYGLVKLDKNSRVLWSYAGNVHHDLDVDEDGTIYTLAHEIVRQEPAGLENIAVPYLADYLVVLTSDGKLKEKIPLLETLRDSAHSLLLQSITEGLKSLRRTTGPVNLAQPSAGRGRPAQVKQDGIQAPTKAQEYGDTLHANGVRVLTRSLAGKFQQLFKQGQVLISLRGIHALVMLDLPTRSVVWAAQGAWRAQHDPEFLENGHLLLYDNSGFLRSTRILEYDPVLQSYPWCYSQENSSPFFAHARGMKQHLPNGNILVVDPDHGRIFEVTRGKQVVWEFGCGGWLRTRLSRRTPTPSLRGHQDIRLHNSCF